MRRNLLLFVLLLSSLFAIGAGKEPYYIVDGQPGVPVDQLPPMEEIDSRKELDPEEAAYIYGKRAANGAVIICTKEYAHRKKVQAEQNKREYERNQAREEQERIQQETIAEQQAIQRQKDHKEFFIIFCVECVLVIYLFWLLFKKSKTRFEEACIIAQQESSKHSFKSERFNVIDSFRFFATIILWLFIAVLCALALWLFYTSGRGNIGHAIILVLIEPLPIFIIIESIIYYRQCYIEIDDEGIRGVCAEYLLAAIPKYKGINIRWGYVSSAKVIDVSWGNRTEKRLVLYSDEDCRKEVDSIFLLYFPTKDITAQVNRSYLRYAGKQLII